MKKLLFTLVAAAGLTSAGFAEDFGLGNINAGDLKISADAVPAPSGFQPAVTRAPNMAAAVLDLSLKLPFKALSSRLADLPGAQIKPIEPSEPVLFKEGDHITFSNVTVNYNGIEAEPTIKIKPFFEGNNKLAIKVVKIEADISFGPRRAMLDKDGLMEMVMTKLSTGMLEAMDKAFAANKVPLKAKDVMAFSYDRTSWTLHATVSPGFIAPLMPGLITNVHLTNFSFDEAGFSLSVKSGSAASIAALPGFNLAMSDGLLDNFILQFTKNSDFTLHPAGKEGGLKFRADGRLELAGKIYARDVTLKPNVYFKATILPVLTGPNTISVRVDRVDVEKAFGIGIPGFINNWIQGKVVRSVIEALATNPELAKVMTARKIDDHTVELKLKNSAFLPSFAKGAVIKNMKIGNGLIYLAFTL